MILGGLRNEGLQPVTLLQLVSDASSFTTGRVERTPA
jgi:hypothetical protein